MAVALHYVLKIGHRRKAIELFTDVLGMKVLRHEEFEEGCKATCNGPYNGKWSKTMVGYGSEDSNFVLELTYNYSVRKYTLGNDIQGIFIESTSAFDRCLSGSLGEQLPEGSILLKDLEGRRFVVSRGNDRISKVALSTHDLHKTIDYWTRLLGMRRIAREGDHPKNCCLTFGDEQCQVEWREIDRAIDRGTAFGRIAFSVPEDQLLPLQTKLDAEGEKIQTPLVTLDTPGKASVQVVILVDPNDHEICFVGEKAFRELSCVDPKADTLLNEAMANDHSEQWLKEEQKSS